MTENINSMKYWDSRFDNDWEYMHGDEQTVFFANVAIELMPDWFKNQIKEEQLSICDFGCAMGQAVDYLHDVFQTDISGMDFSEKAILSAKTRYPQYNFLKSDIEKEFIDKLQFDVGYISNVLEHLTDPWLAACNLVHYLKKYLVILIPFREKMEIAEHCNKFDLNDIPLTINNFKLIYSAYKDCSDIENALYSDKQIMLIYCSPNQKCEHVKLDSLVKSFEDYLINSKSQQEKIKLIAEIDDLKGKNVKFLDDNINLNKIIANKDIIISKADKTINELQETSNKYLSDNAELNKIIANKDTVIAKADKTINELQESCSKYLSDNAELNRIIANKDTVILKADETINELQKSCNKYLNDNAELNKIIANKDTIIAKADETINDLQETSNKYLNDKVELNKIISNYELDLDYSKNLIYNLQIENERIKKTFSWRLTKPLRYIGHCIKLIKSMLCDPRILYGTLRKSAIYKRVFKRFVPQRLKDKLMHKYFTSSEDLFLFENDQQERQVFNKLFDFGEKLENDDQLILVFSGVKYIDSEGQRNIRLIHEAKNLDKKVIFAYWRWDTNEELELDEENMVKIPIDILAAKKVYFFETFFKNIRDKCLLVEFPHPYSTQIIEIANSFGWKTVYDVIDDWEEFAKCGQAGWYRKEVERRVANIVDINVATAYRLRDKIKQDIVEDKPYYVITNGVDPNRMKKSDKIPDYDHSKGKLQIGYFGHLTDAWFDWRMLDNIAKKHQEWTFHIIGYGSPENLHLSANIILYGKKPPEELPKYAAYWNVAIIPFINNELTRGVNPIKVFEYLQLRLPVVASDMPEIANYPYVTLAIGEEAFEKAIIDAANIEMDDETVQRFIEANTWKRKCAELLESIEKIKK